MNLDYFTLAALAAALRPKLLGARTQRVLAIDDWAIGLELYGGQQRHQLYLSTDNQEPRIQLVPGPLRRGLAKPQPLTQYLRSHLLGARLRTIEQPAWERILHFHFETPARAFTLIAEPMPRRANLLLVEEGIIRECLRRIGPDLNRHRLSLPQHRYQPPPPQVDKLPPWPINVSELAQRLNEAGKTPLVRALSQHLLAIGPLLAREICQRAAFPPKLPAQDCDPRSVHAALAELIPPLLAGEWQPGVALDPATGRALAFSPYPATQYEEWRPCQDMNEALARYYGAPTGRAAYDAAKAPIQATIEETRRTLARRRVAIVRELQDEGKIHDLRKSGELILAYQYEIAAGQDQLIAAYEPESPPLSITLDPQKTALENSQSYFQRYQKAKRAQAGGPARLKSLARDDALLEMLAADLLLAESWPEIDEVSTALEKFKNPQPSRKKQLSPARSGPRRLVWEGYVLWLGRNMRQNAAILTRHSQPSDLWLHAQGYPGAHLVIRNDGRKIPEALIQKAASIAAFYSTRRVEAAVDVDVCERRHVRPVKGGAPGMVRYSGERTVRVKPQDESILLEEVTLADETTHR